MVPVFRKWLENGASLCMYLEIIYLSYILLAYRFFAGEGIGAGNWRLRRMRPSVRRGICIWRRTIMRRATAPRQVRDDRTPSAIRTGRRTASRSNTATIRSTPIRRRTVSPPTAPAIPYAPLSPGAPRPVRSALSFCPGT